MGGLMRAPRPVVIETPQGPAQSAVQGAAQAEAAEDAARAARLRAAERARFGLSGTVATSARGVLDPAPAFLQRKTLLGE